jgi:hypothetical protein
MFPGAFFKNRHTPSIWYHIQVIYKEYDRSSELLYRCFFDIVLRWYRSSRLRHQRFFDIVLVRYRKLQPISKVTTFDIEGYNLRYWSYNLQNISKVLRTEAIDIELSYFFCTRYRRSFPDLQYRRLHLRYRNIRTSKVQPSISKVGKLPDDMTVHGSRYTTNYIKIFHTSAHLSDVWACMPLPPMHCTLYPAVKSENIDLQTTHQVYLYILLYTGIY